MKVENIINSRGNKVANQFILTDNGKMVFQSYESECVKVECNIITFGRDWDYSNTTLKHAYIFLKDYCNVYGLDNKKSVEKAIKDGKHDGFEILYDENMR